MSPAAAPAGGGRARGGGPGVSPRPPATPGPPRGGGGGEPPVSTTSCGRFAGASRLAMLIAVELAVASAKLTLPLPLTSGVTSSAIVLDSATAPEDAVGPTASGGALLQLIVVSAQLLLPTP